MMRALDPRVMPWIGAAASAIAISVAWSAGFQPAAGAARHARVQAEALSGQIAAVEAMVLAAGGTSVWRQRHDARLQRLQARLPGQEQLPGVLNAVDAVFRHGGLALRNVSQGSLEPVLENSVPVVSGALACYRLPLSVSVEGRYHELVDAFAQLTGEEFPGLISVDRLQLRRLGEGPQVDATVTLTVFVTGQRR